MGKKTSIAQAVTGSDVIESIELGKVKSRWDGVRSMAAQKRHKRYHNLAGRNEMILFLIEFGGERMTSWWTRRTTRILFKHQFISVSDMVQVDTVLFRVLSLPSHEQIFKLYLLRMPGAALGAESVGSGRGDELKCFRDLWFVLLRTSAN